MGRLRMTAALALGAALLMVTSALAAGPYPPPSQGSGRVEPSRIKIGECATFYGDGFLPGATVTITDNGAAAGTARANAQGEFAKQLCYGTNAKRGRHDLAGSGTGSDGLPLTVTAVLIVTGVQQSSRNDSTQPGGGSSAPAGTSGDTGSPEVVTGSAGAAEGPETRGNYTAATGDENSGLPALGLSVLGLVTALLASLLLLLLLLRRRHERRGDELDAPPLPA